MNAVSASDTSVNKFNVKLIKHELVNVCVLLRAIKLVIIFCTSFDLAWDQSLWNKYRYLCSFNNIFHLLLYEAILKLKQLTEKYITHTLHKISIIISIIIAAFKKRNVKSRGTRKFAYIHTHTCICSDNFIFLIYAGDNYFIFLVYAINCILI